MMNRIRFLVSKADEVISVEPSEEQISTVTPAVPKKDVYLESSIYPLDEEIIKQKVALVVCGQR